MVEITQPEELPGSVSLSSSVLLSNVSLSYALPHRKEAAALNQVNALFEAGPNDNSHTRHYHHIQLPNGENFISGSSKLKLPQ